MINCASGMLYGPLHGPVTAPFLFYFTRKSLWKGPITAIFDTSRGLVEFQRRHLRPENGRYTYIAYIIKHDEL